MHWQAGDAAPDFLALDIQGRRVRLGSQRGRHVLLCFLRDPAEPASRLHLSHLSQARDLLREAGIDAAVFFPCGRERLRAEVGGGIPGLPVVPDPQARLYRLYGIPSQPRSRLHALAQVRARMEAETEGLHVPPMRRSIPLTHLPAQFLVGPDGRLAFVHYGRDPADVGPAPEDLLRAPQRRAAGGPDPAHVRGGATDTF